MVWRGYSECASSRFHTNESLLKLYTATSVCFREYRLSSVVSGKSWLDILPRVTLKVNAGLPWVKNTVCFIVTLADRDPIFKKWVLPA